MHAYNLLEISIMPEKHMLTTLALPKIIGTMVPPVNTRQFKKVRDKPQLNLQVRAWLYALTMSILHLLQSKTANNDGTGRRYNLQSPVRSGNRRQGRLHPPNGMGLQVW